MTDAEKKLWLSLRDKQLKGVSFRKQHPVGNYIVDFCAPSLKLIVELDGGQHAYRQSEDAVRTRWLEDRGFQIVRFWNNDVIENLAGVLEEIANVVVKQKTTTP